MLNHKSNFYFLLKHNQSFNDLLQGKPLNLIEFFQSPFQVWKISDYFSIKKEFSSNTFLLQKMCNCPKNVDTFNFFYSMSSLIIIMYQVSAFKTR